ncbi:MAG: alanine--tRNA ligase [Candidatus Paceibacterota bacterium]|jgi:alanyl-tRNA synthetase|nr:alanine--tRNA ligase [Candidatus Paceibacterota bacterium]MDD4874993.1 alanine--tRNA ligase [Candidatus Paceibacterota bacterium]
MESKEVREKFLKYLEKKGCKITPSASLVPENDPTTLFTSAGMQQMVPYLLGEKHPLGARIANSQKCFRAKDIEEVGDLRHNTFFEMLGDWSFNDFFKKEQISWIFEFLTEEIGLDPKRLYITAFRGSPQNDIPKDAETVEIWKELFKKNGIEAKEADFSEKNGMKEGERIFYYDENKNWWSRSGNPENMPEGELGGPDSEIFWDFGEELKLHENSPWKDQPCHVNCDCGRFFEIGNNVFMQYIKEQGKIRPFSKKNVDFGGGLERIVAASQSSPDVFKTDLFLPVINHIEKISEKKYAGSESENDKCFRVIADHIRAAVFLISDGANPSNKAQGYFTRRVIRRAVVKAQKLGINENFMARSAEIAYNIYDGIYDFPKQKVEEELEKEESKFRKTLAEGLKRFNNLVSENADSGKKLLRGSESFYLYQSFGFPKELIQELAAEEDFEFDEKGFDNEFLKHQELSRTASAGMFKGGLADAGEQTTKLHTAAHLMLAALRSVLGSHVSQKGSNITAERLRFDFSHPQKVTPEELEKVEALVNEQIAEDIAVEEKEMSLEEAKNQGAVGAFENKYGEAVKVYTIGGFSKEICGGPHVKRTGELGAFKIIKEESSSSGIRRIKAVLN